jgi:hypothetical protein
VEGQQGDPCGNQNWVSRIAALMALEWACATDVLGEINR